MVYGGLNGNKLLLVMLGIDLVNTSNMYIGCMFSVSVLGLVNSVSAAEWSLVSRKAEDVPGRESWLMAVMWSLPVNRVPCQVPDTTNTHK